MVQNGVERQIEKFLPDNDFDLPFSMLQERLQLNHFV